VPAGYVDLTSLAQVFYRGVDLDGRATVVIMEVAVGLQVQFLGRV
jgi:hypothetical protein